MQNHLKLAPDIEQSRRLFCTYVATSEGEAMNCVASGRLSQDDAELENVKIIYQIDPMQGGRFHFGSRMIFDQDGSPVKGNPRGLAFNPVTHELWVWPKSWR